MKNIYQDGSYLSTNPTWHVEDSAWKAVHILKMLSNNKFAPSTVCEIGCGAGEILVEMSRNMSSGVSFSGYEISPQAYKLAQERKSDNVQFILGDLLVEKREPFDLVMAIDVFEHIEDCFGFLRKLREKGKYFIFHIPLDLSVRTVLRPKTIMHARQSIGHIHYFNKETAVAILIDAGYEIIDHFYTAGGLELSRVAKRPSLANLPRRLLYPVMPDITVRLFGGYSLMVFCKQV